MTTYRQGFTAGVMCGTTICAAIVAVGMWGFILPKDRAVTDSMLNALGEQGRLITKLEQNEHVLQARAEKCEGRTNQGVYTFLYEPGGGSAPAGPSFSLPITLGASGIQADIGPAISAALRKPTQQGSAATWIITGQVEVRSGLKGAQYSYIDGEGNESGPFNAAPIFADPISAPPN